MIAYEHIGWLLLVTMCIRATQKPKADLDSAYKMNQTQLFGRRNQKKLNLLIDQCY